jgi:5-methylthioadenosine/S-adenosylhomocysteine deaminase
MTDQRLNENGDLQPDIIIKGGTLVSMKEGQDPINDAWVYIKDDRITDIRYASEERAVYGDPEIIDAKKGIIMPGLINSHSHTAMTIFRGFADDLPLKEWLFEKIFPAETKHLNPETVYWGTLLGCIEMIASGTTSVIDGYFFQNDTARAFKKAGLRGLLAQGVIDFPAPGVADPTKNLDIGREFIEKWINTSPLITPGLFCHSLSTCSDKTLIRAMEISQEYSLPLQIHLSETHDEVDLVKGKTGQLPVHYMNGIGLLDSQLIAVHSVHLTDEEIELLASKDVKLVHVPESNMKLSSGVARVSDMLKLGISVGLGTDGCASNNNLDLFQEMDIAAKLGKVCTLDPENMSADTVLKMATSWGAKVIGLENEIGTLEIGKKADIIVLDGRNPHLVPLYNPVSLLVYSASGSDVKDVIIDGKIIMKDKEFQAVDSVEIMENVKSIASDIAKDK